MDNIPSLDLEYIFAKLYELITGVHVDVADVPREFVFIASQLSIIGMVLSILLFFGLVYVIIRTLQVEHAGLKHMDQEHRKRQEHVKHVGVDTRWDTVVALASSPNESDWRRAILEADIILGELLTARGYPGETLGDQLKAANPLQFTTINLAWEAHRTRNAIAHLGEGFPLSERTTRETIDLYRRVFEEFGII